MYNLKYAKNVYATRIHMNRGKSRVVVYQTCLE
jgi:hypothetical protein